MNDDYFAKWRKKYQGYEKKGVTGVRGVTTPYEPDKYEAIAVTPVTHLATQGVTVINETNDFENNELQDLSHLSHLSHLKIDGSEKNKEQRIQETLIKLRAIEKQRERGEVPSHYTEVFTCRGCGPVWLWPGAGSKDGIVFGCPWCLNRAKNLPVPNPHQAENQTDGFSS